VADNLRVADPAATGERLAALLRRAALVPEAFLERDAATLSGGEAQRACLARALATDPAVLLMDEPTSALDAGATAELETLMRELAAGGVPVVLVTHDDEQLERVADHVVRLTDGRLAGPVEHRHG
jgi:ABC-type phosphate transport system ATPase subunit